MRFLITLLCFWFRGFLYLNPFFHCLVNYNIRSGVVCENKSHTGTSRKAKAIHKLHEG